MIRNRNYYAMVQKGDELEERLTQPRDVMLLYLPLAHNYGRLLHLSRRTSASRSRSCRIRSERRRSFPAFGRRSSRACRVSSRRSTPRLQAKFEEETGVRRKLIDWALDVGRRVSKLRQSKQPVPRTLLAQYGSRTGWCTAR
jgi:long-subunit acyl-CoA synthetase (AMP-forming)